MLNLMKRIGKYVLEGVATIVTGGGVILAGLYHAPVFSFLKASALAISGFFTTAFASPAVMATALITAPTILGIYGIKKVYESIRHFKEDPKKHVARLLFAAAGFSGGAAWGVALGAVVGSFIPIPFVGTALGMLIGGALGLGGATLLFKMAKKAFVGLYSLISLKFDPKASKNPHDPRNISPTNPYKYTLPPNSGSDKAKGQEALSTFRRLKQNLSFTANIPFCKDYRRKKLLREMTDALKEGEMTINHQGAFTKGLNFWSKPGSSTQKAEHMSLKNITENTEVNGILVRDKVRQLLDEFEDLRMCQRPSG